MKRTSKIFNIGTTAFFFLIAMCGLAFAQDGGAEYKAQKLADSYGTIGIAAALAISIAALGGGLGQGRAAAAALDGIARNPGAAGQIRGPMILGLALIESLVIYALIIALLLVLKVG